mmetsp:Transcript_27074/g.55391  ORF Transcript_27074/g.55391 Transcript_27074/m.55391 type:complete len:205 (+) Transcript_27074:1665-2279(+)
MPSEETDNIFIIKSTGLIWRIVSSKTLPVSAVISSVTPPRITAVSPIPRAAWPSRPMTPPTKALPGTGWDAVLLPITSTALATPFTAPPKTLTEPPVAPADVSEITRTASPAILKMPPNWGTREVEQQSNQALGNWLQGDPRGRLRSKSIGPLPYLRLLSKVPHLVRQNLRVQSCASYSSCCFLSAFLLNPHYLPHPTLLPITR